MTRNINLGARVSFHLDGFLTFHAGIDGALEIGLRENDASDWTRVGQAVALRNVAGEAARLQVRVTPSPDDAGTHRAIVAVLDEFLNPVEDFNGAVRLEAEGEVSGLPAALELRGGRGEVEGLQVGSTPARVTARETERGWQVQSNALLPPGQWRHAWGELHFHTDISGDGSGDLRAAYRYARDWLNLGVCAVTDHTPVNDWSRTLEINAEFNAPHRFVTLPAWEWSTNHGHVNFYLRRPEVDAAPNRADAGHPAAQTWPDEVVAVPHHTNIRAENSHADGTPMWHEYDWSLRNPRIRLVEVGQTRGNFEADQLDAAWGITSANIGASVRDALSMGWRIGFVGGTDDHSGYPTRDPARPNHYIGLTGFLTSELTREAVWQAMDARRTYATSGAPIAGEFRVNGAIMGQEIEWRDGSFITFSAQLFGTSRIERVEIISNGECVWRAAPNERDVVLEKVALPAMTTTSAYFYLRLLQSDGHRAHFSPVWLDRA